VIDAVGAQRPVLFGSLDGARSLALLAATRPERVGRLIALSPTARGGAAGAPEFVDVATRTFADPSDYPGGAADDVAGLAVHLAARIMDLGGAGEILVSATVRDLVIGSELTFTERGEHELKGVPGRWAIWDAN